MATPRRSGDSVHDLEASFSGLKLGKDALVQQKRPLEHVTIEGSPISGSSSANTPLSFHTSHNCTILDSDNDNNSDNNDEDDSNDDDDDDDSIHQLTKRIDLNPTPVRKPSVDYTSTNQISKLLVISSGSDDHNTGDHQENFLRTALLAGNNGCLHRTPLQSYLSWLHSDTCIQPAPLTDLLRVHEYSYIQHLQKKCASVESPTSYSDKPSFYAPAGKLDSDTPLVPQSLDASSRFCSAAMSAVDKVMNGEFNRAFVLGRPPGHHAGPNGCVTSDYFWQRPDMTSSGFCLLNTVAVAAAYARYQYGRIAFANSINSNIIRNHTTKPPRIAIVDIDVHHGNGTEEIIKNLSPHITYLPLPSSWSPVATQSYKPWLNESDAKDILFASINLYAGDRFYPCTGNDSNELCSSNGKYNIINVAMTPVGPGPWDAKTKHALSSSKRNEYSALASLELKSKVSMQLIPQLTEFGADILFISAGFDAHVDDYYHFLTEGDYHWLTEQLVSTTAKTGGKVISILEGGYSLTSPYKADKKTSTKESASVKPVERVNVAPRSGRGKNKKYDESVTATTSSGQTITITANGSKEEKEATSSYDYYSVDINDHNYKFAQQPGDGGLVKGVLAHTAALVGKKSWL